MSNNVIKVLDKEVRIIEWQGQRVVMTKDIAKIHGIEVKHINEKYRRNKKYFKEGYDYFEVRVNEIKSAVDKIDHTIKEALFKNTQEYILLITEAGYLNFVKTINDDRAWEIFLDMKKVYVKAQQNKELRADTKEVRKKFTDILKQYGYDEPKHYIKTTVGMKDALNIKAKKDDMTDDELELIMASEILAKHNVINNNKYGFDNVNPVCIDSSMLVKKYVTENNTNLLN